MTLGSPTSTSVLLTYALPDYVAIHQPVFGFQRARASDGHVTHSSVTYLEVKANRENDKEEKEVVPLRDHKNWVKRDMFLQSPASFLFSFFLLQCAELSGEIYSISSRV